MKNLIIVLMAAVLIAGCTGQWTPGQGGTTVEPADVMVAANEPTIPSAPAAGSEFTARFTVTNQHKTNKATDVGVWIYDIGKCKLDRIGGLDAQKTGGIWPGLVLETGAGVANIEDFAAGQQEVVTMSMTAPSSSEIAGLSYNCPIKYFINYTYTAKSSVTVDVMSPSRLRQIETQLGERPVYTRTLNVGAGPIRVMFEPTSTMPIENGDKLSYQVTLKNDGTGDYASVLPGQLVMKLPKEFAAILDQNGKACGGFFEGAGETDNVAAYKNFRKIDVIEMASNPITCEFTVPTDVTVEQEYAITAELPYSYGYFGQVISVPITPK
jgi:hypothetical protein